MRSVPANATRKNAKMAKSFEDSLADFVDEYIDVVLKGLNSRWEQIVPDIYERHFHDCVAALTARQATLTIEMARAPSTWNGHVAPLFLRCMVDAYITLAWIIEDPIERSRKYIHYGLGQEKLFIEYLEEAIRDEPDAHDSESLAQLVEARRTWLNSQLAEWATEVNVGSWSGRSTREMAKDIGRESIYKHAYVPFSGCAHNMWQHIGIYNAETCKNPLHKWHRLPVCEPHPFHPDFMYRSAKYISLTYRLLDEKLGTLCGSPDPEQFFVEHPLFADDDAPTS